MVQYFNHNNKYIGAMCSGTVVLSDAKVIDGKEVTGYIGYAEKLIGGIFKDEVVVADQNSLLVRVLRHLIHLHTKSQRSSAKIHQAYAKRCYTALPEE